jgi:predicted nucleic acid-binding protein
VLVVDASVIAPLVADGGPDGDTYRAAVRGQVLAAPDLLRVEVLSAIRRHTATGQLNARQARRALDDLLDLPVALYATTPLLRRCWELRANVTSYDACYVALAEALDAALLTADARLAAAPGLRCDVTLLGVAP